MSSIKRKRIQNKTHKKRPHNNNNNNNNNKQNGKTKIKTKLNVIRNKYGGCLSFGGESKNVNKLFGFTSDYNNFDDMSSTKKIGHTSSNGFVYKIDYIKDDYKFSAILKSSSDPESDNLFYEYFVGINFINKVNLIYPCFVETYKLFVNTNGDLYNKMKKNIPFDNDLLKEHMISHTIDSLPASIYCTTSECLSILLQTVPNPQSLSEYLEEIITVLKRKKRADYVNKRDKKIDMLKEKKEMDTLREEKEIDINKIKSLSRSRNKKNKTQQTWVEWLNWKKPSKEPNSISKIEMELIQFFYQVYCPLSYLKYKFTHYDLHDENVLLYRLEDNEYITMRYIYPNKTVIEFNTSVIIKIIDYGRSFFVSNTDDNRGPVEFKQTILSEPECNHSRQIHGDYNGFHYLTDDFSESDYITPLKNNPSHDLRLLKCIKEKLHSESIQLCLDDLFIKLKYDKVYGTPSNNKSKQDEVNNVTDVEIHLRKMIQNNNFKNTQTNIFSNPDFIKIGTLNIYVDKDKNMEYIPII